MDSHSATEGEIEVTTEEIGINPVNADDATWILTASFVIFTMQTGFGLLESGAVSKKNEVNILMKNAVDVVLGGLSYWLFGYGLQYGQGPGTTAFCGIGSFMVDTTDDDGGVFATFIFQLSFATTATTIVSGAMAERANFNAYIIFSFVNTVTYCIPAGWMWGEHGFLKKLGAIDFAGSCAVHLTGGASALVAAILLKPRLHRYDQGTSSLAMGDPGNAIIGMFTLWWGWLVFNTGSSFGITGNKWQYSGRAAINTINASLGGGMIALFVSYFKYKTFGVSYTVNGILGALVGVTAGSAFLRPWESIVVGIFCSVIVNESSPLLDGLHIDDPVGAVAVHGVGGVLGMVAVGLFVEGDPLLHMTGGLNGLFKGGGFYFLLIQLFSCLCTALWSMTTTFIILKGINCIVPIRMTKEEEVFGADFNEHDIRHDGYDYKGMTAALQRQGLKVHHAKRKYSPPRSEWDEYLMENYLLDRSTHTHVQEMNGNRWTQMHNGTAATSTEKRIKKILKQMAIGKDISLCNSTSGTCTTGVNGTDRKITYDDATWVMTSSFIIFTMQSGFALLESGSVQRKNEVNVMMKNIVDMVFGGLSYWMFGYGMSYGTAKGTNAFFGVGNYFVDTKDINMGYLYATYIFQLSFASTATTIVSGAVAERFNFIAYCIYSFMNTFVYCLPAAWIWGEYGFLNHLGVVDIAGCCPVHLVGGASALVATLMVGPRFNRYNGKDFSEMGSPTNAMLGMFMLWWGWLGFNCGSTFGVTGAKWKYASRSAITTINASIGGGLLSLVFSSYFYKKKFLITNLINGILSSLVAITAGCVLYNPWEALVIGIISSLLTNIAMPALNELKIDDPVGAVPVHLAGSIWGMIAVGLFVEKDVDLKLSKGEAGVFRQGGFYLLGIQMLAIIVVGVWSSLSTYILLWVINLAIPLRMKQEEEEAGADILEHNVEHYSYTQNRRFSVEASVL